MKALWAPLALVLALAWAAPAPATILFAGGEDIDFSLFSTVVVDTTAGRFRSGYARADFQITSGAGVDPPAIRIVTPAVASQGTVWIHAEDFASATATSSGVQAMGAYGSDGVRRLLVRGTGTAGQVKISTRNAAGTITDLVTCTSGAWPIVALSKVDWYINYAVAGHTTLYVNGVSICDFTGDVTTNSVTALNQADFSDPNSAGGNQLFWSEIIVSTTDTRDMNLLTCAPQANGTNQTWTGTASNVNPTTVNDPVSITTASTSAVAEFTCPALPAGSFTVPAVTQSARAQIGTTGPQNFRYIARPSSGVTDYDNGADILGSTAFTSYTGQVWSTNPAGGNWSTNDLGAGVNFGLKSRP